jgi:hypothetical protein
MTDDRNVEQDELESQDGQPLPDREAMSIITPDPAAGPWGEPTDPAYQGSPTPAPDAVETNEPLRGGEPG